MTYLLKVFGLPGSIALLAAVLLLISTIGTGVAWKMARADATEAEAAVTVLESQRDSARRTASTNGKASDEWKKIAEKRAELLAEAQQENARIRKENQDALADAQAGARDAERTLALFTERYAQSLRNPDCVAARKQLDKTCPTLDY